MGVEVIEVGSDGSRHSLDWAAQVGWQAYPNKDGVILVIPVVTLQFPSGSSPESLRTSHSETEWKPNSDTVRLKMERTQALGVVYFSNGRKIYFAVRLKLVGDEINTSGCSEEKLSVKELANGNPPVFIGIHCRRTKDQVLISIAPPDNLAWGSYEAFETAGKGERWKQFALPLLPSVGYPTTHLKFTLSQNGKELPFDIVPTVELEKPHPIQQSLVAIGLGISSISLTSADASPSKIQPEISVETEPLVFWRLHLGGSFKLAIPFPPSSSNIGFYDAEGYLGFHILSTRLSVIPRIYFVSLGENYDPINASFHHNNAGQGIEIKYALATGASLWAEGLASGYFPSGVSHMYRGALGFDFAKRSSIQWELALAYQHETYSDSSTSVSLQQMIVNVLARF